jgi:uncharacterized protein (DUF1330 family)
MPAYWLSRANIHDPVEYKKYSDLAGDIVRRHGGKILSRGNRFQIMEGPEKFKRFVAIEFPTFEAAVGCYKSPEYQAAAKHRKNGAGEVENVIVDSGDVS